MSILRRFGILILGIALLVIGVVFYAVALPQPSFGWTAYAPLTGTTFVPTPSPNLPHYALGVIGAGLVLVAGWVGFRLGHRRP